VILAESVQGSDKHNQQKLVVWYDGDYPLCRREIHWLQKMDAAKKIEFTDLHDILGCPVEPEALPQRLHAQNPEGKVISGAEAFAAIWREIPLLRPIGLAASRAPILWLFESAYLAFLKIRPQLQSIALKIGLT
jgi:predicted DCC family thiol-disulfide oxidoreductase YuxK